VFGGVVEEVGCTDIFVFVVVYDGGFEAVEGEEVEDLFAYGVLNKSALLLFYDRFVVRTSTT